MPELKCDLISLEVELDDELAGMFRMTVALLLQADGSLDLPGRRPVRASGRRSSSPRVWRATPQRLLTGYITHLRPEFGAGLEQCRLEVWGMDASVLMDRRRS